MFFLRTTLLNALIFGMDILITRRLKFVQTMSLGSQMVLTC